MTCEEALRHDWFKDLLIMKEKELDNRFSITLNIADGTHNHLQKDPSTIKFKDPFEEAKEFSPT